MPVTWRRRSRAGDLGAIIVDANGGILSQTAGSDWRRSWRASVRRGVSYIAGPEATTADGSAFSAAAYCWRHPDIARLIQASVPKAKAHGVNQHTGGGDGGTSSRGSNSTTYLAARLKRDRRGIAAACRASSLRGSSGTGPAMDAVGAARAPGWPRSRSRFVAPPTAECSRSPSGPSSRPPTPWPPAASATGWSWCLAALRSGVGDRHGHGDPVAMHVAQCDRTTGSAVPRVTRFALSRTLGSPRGCNKRASCRLSDN
jgi:hypothetical protein